MNAVNNIEILKNRIKKITNEELIIKGEDLTTITTKVDNYSIAIIEEFDGEIAYSLLLFREEWNQIEAFVNELRNQIDELILKENELNATKVETDSHGIRIEIRQRGYIVYSMFLYWEEWDLISNFVNEKRK